jgi:hypothetical protein
LSGGNASVRSKATAFFDKEVQADSRQQWHIKERISMQVCDPLRRLSGIITLFSLFLVNTVASAQMWINEVYLDPPGSLDNFLEYIEIRGTPGASLADHYLIVLENEFSPTSTPGQIEAVFDLGSLGTPFLGANGFLTLRQAGNTYNDLDPLSTNLQNTAVGATWGSGAFSSVGFTYEGNNGVLENSGGTFMLIKNNGGTATAPRITTPILIDLDADNDNELDDSIYMQNWTILDSVGINSEASENDGYLYAPINFSPGTPDGGGNVPAGATFVAVGFEIEYFGRWGNSTGSTAADWHVTNLTNDPLSGFDGPTDFRQAGDPHGIAASNQFVESNQGVPYGTIITGTMGSENLFIADGDFDAVFDGEQFVFNGVVDGRDFLHWQRNFGFGLNGAGVPRFATRRHGDANGDRVVDGADLAIWQANYGYGNSLVAGLSVAVPEPASWALLLLGTLFCTRRLRVE